MHDKRWDLVDTRDGVRRHPFELPRTLDLPRRDPMDRAGFAVVGDDEDSMVGRLVADIEPPRAPPALVAPQAQTSSANQARTSSFASWRRANR